MQLSQDLGVQRTAMSGIIEMNATIHGLAIANTDLEGNPCTNERRTTFQELVENPCTNVPRTTFQELVENPCTNVPRTT
jgi:hypothetical protein